MSNPINASILDYARRLLDQKGRCSSDPRSHELASALMDALEKLAQAKRALADRDAYAEQLADCVSNVRGLLVAYFCGEREKDHYAEEALTWCDTTLGIPRGEMKTPPSSGNDGARPSPHVVEGAEAGQPEGRPQGVEAPHVPLTEERAAFDAWLKSVDPLDELTEGKKVIAFAAWIAARTPLDACEEQKCYWRTSTKSCTCGSPAPCVTSTEKR